MAGAGYFWGHSSKPQADAKRTKRLDRASEEAKKTKTGFITEKDEGYLYLDPKKTLLH